MNDNHSAFFNLQPQLRLPAGVPLALHVELIDAPQTGWLQILGTDVFREYMLPDSGVGLERYTAPRGFGSLPSSSRTISLFTRHEGETPRLINIVPAKTNGADFDFARFELWRYDPRQLPVAVDSWVPYRLTVRTPQTALLEVPRVWMRGYHVTVNGHDVAPERSPDSLLMAAVPAGESHVTIEWRPGQMLRLAYWGCITAWLVLILFAAIRFVTPAPEA